MAGPEQYFPAGHDRQSATFLWPGTALYVPAMQATHIPDPATQYPPAGHSYDLCSLPGRTSDDVLSASVVIEHPFVVSAAAHAGSVVLENTEPAGQ